MKNLEDIVNLMRLKLWSSLGNRYSLVSAIRNLCSTVQRRYKPLPEIISDCNIVFIMLGSREGTFKILFDSSRASQNASCSERNFHEKAQTRQLFSFINWRFRRLVYKFQLKCLKYTKQQCTQNLLAPFTLMLKITCILTALRRVSLTLRNITTGFPTIVVKLKRPTILSLMPIDIMHKLGLRRLRENVTEIEMVGMRHG